MRKPSTHSVMLSETPRNYSVLSQLFYLFDFCAATTGYFGILNVGTTKIVEIHTVYFNFQYLSAFELCTYLICHCNGLLAPVLAQLECVVVM